MSGNFSNRTQAALIVFATLIATVAGCRDNISPSELPGTWTISRTSQHLFSPEFDVSQAKLVLNSDETFTATGLPQELILIHATNREAVARINGSGRWKLLERNGFSNTTGFMLEFKAIQGPQTYRLPFSTMIFSVDKTGDTVKLFYFHDDPDLGRRIDFEKSPSTN